MNNCKPFAVIIALLSLGSLLAAGPVTAVRVTERIALDGRLDEPVWRSVRPVSEFLQREPVQGAPASERTEVWVAYDDNALYVAARLHDASPDSIMALLDRRDNLNTADWFGVFLDPYRDKRSGNYFVVGPTGSIGDGAMYNDDWDDSDWDGVWEAKTGMDTGGWTVEMMIPFSQLRFQEKPVQEWGVNFRRDIGRKNEQSYLVYTPRGESGFVSRFQPLLGIEGIRPSTALEVRPFVTGKHERTHPSAGDPFNPDGVRNFGDAGADIKYGISSNLILDATVNPDFGQVEVDPAVVNLSDVESFFQEKRPFFIEGASTFSNFGRGGGRNFWNFNYPQPTIFYSRRIGRAPYGNDTLDADYTDAPIATRILGAAKVTGKLGDGWNVGTIHALTAREFTPFRTGALRGDAEIEPQTYYGVARVQKELNGGRQGLGVLSTYTARGFSDRTFADVMNHTSLFAGADGWTFLDEDRSWVVTGYGGVSRVEGSRERMVRLQRNSTHYFQRPDASHVEVDSAATSLTGFSGRFYLIKQKGSTYVNAALGVIDPNFEINDLGFLSRTDVINAHVGGGYMWTEPEGIFRFRELGGGVGASTDFSGLMVHNILVHWGYAQFVNYWSINYNLAFNFSAMNNTRRTRGGPVTINRPGSEVNFNIMSDDRKPVRLEVGSNLFTSGQRRYTSFWSSVVFRPAPHINFSVGPQYLAESQRLAFVDIVDDAAETRTFGRQYLFGRLAYRELSANIRLNWTFTPALTLQLYMQPLFSSGDYSEFKQLAAPRSDDYLVFGTGPSTLAYDAGADEYEFDSDGAGGPSAPKRFGDPDFNFRSLRGNAVLRWEYRPGSALYLVWTQSRYDVEDDGEFRMNRSAERIANARPDNIIMLKLTYYFAM
ncbi:MAG: carbohydrate binding family 9 domain-containing protein [Bacteroidetes bacterium]|nr:MAG: carbohydrate binding family 9 domain-containing protein [Bacteroidota bacterium]